MDGYCAVCLREKGEWVRGLSDHRVLYDGKIYYFPGEMQKEMFLADPVKYIPALHGDCLVCKVDMGERVAGSVHFGVDYRDRFYFFPSAKQREMFKANPLAYATADVAFGGECAVCRVEMKQRVAGSDEFMLIHDGMRYLFPGPEQMKMFQSNPAKYEIR